jgi:hypothetical protein
MTTDPAAEPAAYAEPAGYAAPAAYADPAGYAAPAAYADPAGYADPAAPAAGAVAGATARTVAAATLVLNAALVGVWAGAFPLSFHRDFPFPGAHWVSALGPYDEHLVRDVGGLYLALLVLSVATLRRPSLATTAGGAWLVFSAEHLLWHAVHLDVFPRFHQVASMAALSIPLICSIVLLGAGRAAPAAARDRSSKVAAARR